MAKNQLGSGSLLDAKIVPLTRLHWWRQLLHWKYSRPCRLNSLCQVCSQRGQTNPLGQRQARTQQDGEAEPTHRPCPRTVP